MGKMNSENRLCCYFSDNRCILQDVEINELGMCDCQILVPFDEEELSPKREALLARFEQQEREWESADEPN